MTWTNETVEQLKTLWAEGQSASVIACRISGKTRNAVLGKVHRLGLPGRATCTRTHTPRQRTQSLRVRSRARRQPATTPRIKPPRASRVLPELAPAPAVTITVATLTSLTCRWPVGDPFDANFHFCGRAADEHAPYCPHHMVIARR